MNNLRFAISCSIMLLMASCNSKEEPLTPPQYRISWIYFNDSYQLFDYDASGRISKWEYNESKPGLTVDYTSSYAYSEDGNMVTIASEEKFGSNTWIFNEKLYLNQDGTANHAVGTVLITNKDGHMMKNYNAEFHYNSLKQLTEVRIAEKRTNETGWEEANALEWVAELKWADNNLVKYSEYINPANPLITKAFVYYGGETAHYKPIVQGPIVRRYYLPLQYQGILGKQSIGMVKTMSTTSNDLQMTSEYSYNIATSIYNSRVEGYSRITDDNEVEYTVAWEEI